MLPLKLRPLFLGHFYPITEFQGQEGLQRSPRLNSLLLLRKETSGLTSSKESKPGRESLVNDRSLTSTKKQELSGRTQSTPRQPYWCTKNTISFRIQTVTAPLCVTMSVSWITHSSDQCPPAQPHCSRQAHISKSVWRYGASYPSSVSPNLELLGGKDWARLSRASPGLVHHLIHNR